MTLKTARQISVFFPGIAVSKLRARQGKKGWYTPAETVAYERELGLIAKNQMQLQEVEAFEKDVPLSIVIAFVKKGKLTSKPDLDNLVKSCLDSLAHDVCYHDDSQIVRLVASKANPRDGESIGVAIRIESIAKPKYCPTCKAEKMLKDRK